MVTEAMKKLMDYFRPKTQVAQPVEQVKPARPKKEERRAAALPAAKKVVKKAPTQSAQQFSEIIRQALVDYLDGRRTTTDTAATSA